MPLCEYEPLIWMGGVVCLWLTRYTHQLGKRWGQGFYLLAFALWVLSIHEDRELAAHFGKAYEVYVRKVPRLSPN